ncbi:HNH endonuclease [Paenibacillus sp. V4I5]|uniref:HNH endonuclease n=1 Tax=Paenibacillus sp. V4I5 TaxID=3042306 RepID=UPI00278D6360|nr:HNH endonuclease [Paenibacillus sp. V4I5]MDQ0917537.1 5-methylcytosine-specific restriction endonuclease McrA [Paenibacillus sp. V4I5]
MANRPSEHQRAIRHAKERENHTCQLCGSKENVQGHHLIDYGFGGEASPDNIVAVCGDCHGKIHRGEITVKVHDYR